LKGNGKKKIRKGREKKNEQKARMGKLAPKA